MSETVIWQASMGPRDPCVCTLRSGCGGLGRAGGHFFVQSARCWTTWGKAASLPPSLPTEALVYTTWKPGPLCPASHFFLFPFSSL